MKLNYKQWKSLLLLELGLCILYSIIKIIINKDVNAINVGVSLFLVIYVIFIWSIKEKELRSKVQIVLRWVGILSLPWILEIIWLNLFSLWVGLTAKIKWLSGLVCLIGVIIYFLMFIPIVRVLFSKVSYPWMQMIAWLSLIPVVYDGLSKWNVVSHPYLTMIINTGALGAITFIFIVRNLSDGWGYGSNLNLKFNHSQYFSQLIIWMLIGYALINIIWMNLSNSPFIFMLYNATKSLSFNFRAICQATEAGVLEELCRYLTIIILFKWYNKKKSKLCWIIVWSALIFSLQHIVNLQSQTLWITVEQMIVVLGYGLFYADLFLYTGKLWLSMLLHGLLDYSVFINTQDSIFQNINPVLEQTIVLSLGLIIPMLLTIWLLTGKRKIVMQNNLLRLVEE